MLGPPPPRRESGFISRFCKKFSFRFDDVKVSRNGKLSCARTQASSAASHPYLFSAASSLAYFTVHADECSTAATFLDNDGRVFGHLSAVEGSLFSYSERVRFVPTAKLFRKLREIYKGKELAYFGRFISKRKKGAVKTDF